MLLYDMSICDKCGKEFDKKETEYEFESGHYSDFPLSFDRLERCLCLNCAIEEYENGNYYEICECCGKLFNPDSDQFDFENQVSDRVIDAEMYEYGIHCADCAAKKLLDSLDNNDN